MEARAQIGSSREKKPRSHIQATESDNYNFTKLSYDLERN